MINSADPYLLFLLGFLGSFAVEVGAFCKAYERGRLPQRFKKVGFWCVRTLLALCAGGLAVGYFFGASEVNLIAVVNVGASAPLIISALAEGVASRTGR